MKRNIALALLAIVMLLLNVGFIIITLKKQETFELVYNIFTTTLNILYYIIVLLPEEEDD